MILAFVQIDGISQTLAGNGGKGGQRKTENISNVPLNTSYSFKVGAKGSDSIFNSFTASGSQGSNGGNGGCYNYPNTQDRHGQNGTAGGYAFNSSQTSLLYPTTIFGNGGGGGGTVGFSRNPDNPYWIYDNDSGRSIQAGGYSGAGNSAGGRGVSVTVNWENGYINIGENTTNINASNNTGNGGGGASAIPTNAQWSWGTTWADTDGNPGSGGSGIILIQGFIE